MSGLAGLVMAERTIENCDEVSLETTSRKGEQVASYNGGTTMSQGRSDKHPTALFCDSVVKDASARGNHTQRSVYLQGMQMSC